MRSPVRQNARVKLKDLPREERPRERIMKHGPGALNNQELMAAILGTGNRKETVVEIAQRLSTYNLGDLSHLTVAELKTAFGIKDAKACQLIAAIELGKRIVTHATQSKRKVETSDDIVRLFMPNMKGLKQEILKCLYLDAKLQVLNEGTVSLGGLNTTSIRPADIFRTAITEGAAALVLVHNHPSGDPTPSKNDIHVTRELARAGTLLGIEVIDHLIIGGDSYTSLKESGVL